MLRRVTKAFEGFGPSFRKDGSLEHLHRFGVAEHHDLSAIEDGTVAAPPQFCAESVPAKNAFDIPRLSPDHTTLCGGLRRKDMGDPLIRIDNRRLGAGRSGGKDISHIALGRASLVNFR